MKNIDTDFTEPQPRPDINGLIKDLEDYNDYFSIGAALGRGIAGRLHTEDDAPSEEETQKKKLVDLNRKHRGTLKSLGISL